jgi:hypothetical protein
MATRIINESWHNTQELINTQSTEIGYKLDLIKNAKGRDDSRVGLHNIGIVLNNKLATEVVRVFFEHGIYDLDNDPVYLVIYKYLMDLEKEGVKYLEKYFKENIITRDTYSRIIYSNHTGLINYKAFLDKIFSFDIKEDFMTALLYYLNTMLKSGNCERISTPEKAIDYSISFFNTLNKLGMYDLYGRTIEIIDNANIFYMNNSIEKEGTYLEKTK